MVDMADMVMESTGRKMKKNKKKFLIVIGTILAAMNLFILFFTPDLFQKEEKVKITEEDGKGAGKSRLTVEKKERYFDGKGLFDPMEGVQAFDIDGSKITEKVAVSYQTQKVIDQKTIHYIVFDSNDQKLESICSIQLRDYNGPKIQFEEIEKVSWEDLQNLVDVLIKKECLFGDDGFGKDVSSNITYFYEILPESKEATVTFSLINQFQDYCSEKLLLPVEGIPEDYFE